MKESKTRGLRFSRDIGEKEFVEFFRIVQDSALSKGNVFFFDTGAGNDFNDGVIAGEDLMGWLVPASEADDFEKRWIVDDISDEMDEMFAIARWSKNGSGISVSFDTGF